MKKIIIGRNNACDIIIADTSDLVSRKQAVLAVYFWGKMLLFDTSNNGTYVNGKRIENGKAVKVTKKDHVNFAKVADLDWNEVKDPYRKLKNQCLVGATVLAFVLGGLAWWILNQHTTDKKKGSATETEILAPPRGETITTVDTSKKQQSATVEQSQSGHKPSAVPKSPAVKRNSKDKKHDNEHSGKDVIDKKSNDNTPIVY